MILAQRAHGLLPSHRLTGLRQHGRHDVNRVLGRNGQLRVRLLNGEKERGVAEIVGVLQEHAGKRCHQYLRALTRLIRTPPGIEMQKIMTERHWFTVEIRRRVMDAIEHFWRSYLFNSAPETLRSRLLPDVARSASD